MTPQIASPGYRPKYGPSEAEIAKTFVQYVRLKYPEESRSLIHIPNEGKRSQRQGIELKLQGLVPGVSDYFFAIPLSNYAGLWLELKSSRGKESYAQKAFGQRMLKNGYSYHCVYGLDAAILCFEGYLHLRPVKS